MSYLKLMQKKEEKKNKIGREAEFLLLSITSTFLSRYMIKMSTFHHSICPTITSNTATFLMEYYQWRDHSYLPVPPVFVVLWCTPCSLKFPKSRSLEALKDGTWWFVLSVILNKHNERTNSMAYGNTEVQSHIHKGSPVTSILNQINPIPRIDTYFFKIYSNIVLPSMARDP